LPSPRFPIMCIFASPSVVAPAEGDQAMEVDIGGQKRAHEELSWAAFPAAGGAPATPALNKEPVEAIGSDAMAVDVDGDTVVGADGDAASLCAATEWEQGSCSWDLEEAACDGGHVAADLAGAIFDVVADTDGAMWLLPVGGPEAGRMERAVRISELPDEAVVTIRTFRFFEDRGDEKFLWEKELRNVNSGSLLWMVVHMQPKFHSVAGCKYGQYFTVHHIRVRAACFKNGYHMAQEGSCPFAKAFGATVAVKGIVTGQNLSTGYFWFVSPAPSGTNASQPEHLEKYGWQHVSRQGPYDGEVLLAEWQAQGSPMQEVRLQQLLERLQG